MAFFDCKVHKQKRHVKVGLFRMVTENGLRSLPSADGNVTANRRQRCRQLTATTNSRARNGFLPCSDGNARREIDQQQEKRTQTIARTKILIGYYYQHQVILLFFKEKFMIVGIP